MSDIDALSPSEAAYIAANVYFTLDGMEANYLFKKAHGDKAKGAPKPRPGMASSAVVHKNVVGSGDRSVAKTGINKGVLVNSFTATTGSNLVGRTKSGFGYMLQFERSGRNHLVIATRGTSPDMGYPDLLTDANTSLLRNLPGVGPVHAGFYDVYNSLLLTLSSAKDVVNAADVLHCVGHSLGGAVANLIALHFAKLRNNVKLYTFGAPRVGLRSAMYDKVADRIIGENNIFRVSHNFDPIPMIPVAPYIHVLPSVKDKNNFFIGSPIANISLDNHDTGNYIASVQNKDWNALRADKLNEGYLDKQYFNSWRASESWLKQYIGHTVNSVMGILQRILQGLVDTLGIGFTEIATVLDLLAIAIRNGIEIYQVSKSYVVKFISDCARMFGMAVDVSREVLTKLFRKLMVELAIVAKQSLARASKVTMSREFHIILATASAGSIGLLLI